MNELKVRDLILKEGMPAICVSLSGVNADALLRAYKDAAESCAQLFELRTDGFAGKAEADVAAINDIIAKMRADGDQRPVILTFRTREEGGMKHLPVREYYGLIREYITESDADIIDVEALGKDDYDTDPVSFLTDLAHENGKLVILSNHDFTRTPKKEEILARLKKMADMGADIPKVAYMPADEDDVHKLLEAAAMYKEERDRLFIALSMGETGKASRICAGMFGSCVTFAAPSGSETAPGQMDAEATAGYLREYYEGNE